MNGPEPTISGTGLFGSVAASRAGIITGIVWPDLPRASITKANGRSSSSTKRLSSSTRKSRAASIILPPSGSRLAQRRIEATQSAAVTGVPSLHFSPSRSRKV